MVGIPSFGNAETIGYVVRAATAGMVQYFPDLKPVLVNSDGGSPDDTPRVAVSTESPDYIEKIILVRPRHKLQRISFTYQGISGKGTAVRALFEVARELKVKAMVMVDSDLRSIVPEWVELLAGPILKGGYDFVAPLYARYKYDGTITNNISYPLTRALYGQRIRQPIGGDFAISGDLVSRYLELDTFDESAARFGIDIWMTIRPSTRASPSARHALAPRSTTPRTRLLTWDRCSARSLARSFAWPGATGALAAGKRLTAIPEYGFERVVAPEPITVNHAKLIDDFDSARLTQGPAWAEILAPNSSSESCTSSARRPATLPLPRRAVGALPVRRARRLPAPGTDRERLLAALTPLYFGRTAGFISRDAGDDDRPGRARDRRAGARVRGAQALPRGALAGDARRSDG